MAGDAEGAGRVYLGHAGTGSLVHDPVASAHTRGGLTRDPHPLSFSVVSSRRRPLGLRPELGHGLTGRPWAASSGIVFTVGALLHAFGVLHDRLPAPTPVLLLLPALACLLLTPRKELRLIRVNLPLALLLGWLAVSVLWATDPSTTISLVRDQVPLLLALVAVSQVLSPAALRLALRLAVGIALGLVVLALLADPSTRTSIDPAVPLDGWRGSFLHKNLLGLFLAFALAVILCFERGRMRVAMIVVATTLLVGSQSATGIAGGVVVMVIYYWAIRYGAQNRAGRRALILASVAALSGALVIVLSNVSAVLAAFGKDPDLTGRTEIWSVVLPAVGDRPWTGYGLGGLLNADVPTAFTYDLWLQIGDRAPHAHSGVLDIVGQLGVVGLLLYGVAAGATLLTAIRGLSQPAASSLFVMCLMGGQLLMSVSENVFLGPWLLVLVILQAMMMSQVRRRGSGDPAPPR